MKWRKIESKLEAIEKNLANAESYIAKDINVCSVSQFRLDDWKGKSGRPLWIKNHMIPRTKKWRARLEQALERMDTQAQKRAAQKLVSKSHA